MIELTFSLASEMVLVRIEGNNVRFGNSTFGARLATIDGLKLDRQGVIREFPDLKDNEEWRTEAIKRFKDKIGSMAREDEVSDYIVKELKTCGYKPKLKHKQGFRAEVIV